MVKVRQPHERATHEDLKLHVMQDQQTCIDGTSARQNLFEKTLSLYHAYCAHGCLGPPDTSNKVTIQNSTQDDQWSMQNERSRRGHEPKITCDGRLIFDHDLHGKAFVR